MSQWTHVQGCLLLSSQPFEFKKIKVEKPANFRNREEQPELEEAWEKWRRAYIKSAYLPYPEEQFKINTPTMINRWCKETKKNPEGNETVLHTQANIYSLPRARKYIEEAFKLLPQGETGFTYSIKQDCTNSSSSCSCFEYTCLFKYYKEALEKLYYNEDSWYRYTFKDLVKYQHIDKDCWVNYCDEIVIGIVEDLRYCSAQELEESLEKFIAYLEKNSVNIDSGLLEFIDDWEENRKHVFRASSYGGYTFETIDTSTNKVIKLKTYSYPKDEKGWNDYDKFEESGWIIKEEEF